MLRKKNPDEEVKGGMDAKRVGEAGGTAWRVDVEHYEREEDGRACGVAGNGNICRMA